MDHLLVLQLSFIAGYYQQVYHRGLRRSALNTSWISSQLNEESFTSVQLEEKCWYSFSCLVVAFVEQDVAVLFTGSFWGVWGIKWYFHWVRLKWFFKKHFLVSRNAEENQWKPAFQAAPVCCYSIILLHLLLIVWNFYCHHGSWWAEINPSELPTRVYRANHPLSHVNLHAQTIFSMCGSWEHKNHLCWYVSNRKDVKTIKTKKHSLNCTLVRPSGAT